jgi:hypothetical protein
MLHLSWLLFAAFAAQAQTLYVTDKVEAPVYAQPSLEGDRVRLLESGDAVELVRHEAENALVRLEDGSEGWMAATYLVVDVPARLQLEKLTTENERLRAAARTEAAAAPSSELKTLKDRNAELQSALTAAQRDLDALKTKAPAAESRPDDEVPIEAARPTGPRGLYTALTIIGGGAATLALGFWWGYSTLERRVRRKYGGLKVY